MTRDQIDARMGRLPLYVSFMGWTANAKPGSDEHREIGRRHLQFQLDNQDRGILLGAGPIDADRKDEVARHRAAGLEKGRPSTPSACRSSWRRHTRTRSGCGRRSRSNSWAGVRIPCAVSASTKGPPSRWRGR